MGSPAFSHFGISPAEYAVMWHVRDTVVQPRDMIADWAASYPPNDVPVAITVEDCLGAIDALICRGLLVELTVADIEADLARWRAEPLPVSSGVDLRRRPGDVDLTEKGFQLIEAVMRVGYPERSPLYGYNDETPGVIRVFGETEECCQHRAKQYMASVDEAPWRWPRDSAQIDAMHPLGPWWYSRFELVSSGFVIAIRRVDQRPPG